MTIENPSSTARFATTCRRLIRLGFNDFRPDARRAQSRPDSGDLFAVILGDAAARAGLTSKQARRWRRRRDGVFRRRRFFENVSFAIALAVESGGRDHH